MKTKMREKIVRLTKREAEMLVASAQAALHVYGAPDCPKCEKAFWSAVEKLDSIFKLEAVNYVAAD